MSVHNRLHELMDLRKVLENSDEASRQFDALHLLSEFPVNREILKQSGVAKVVGRLREKGESLQVRTKALELVDLWKKLTTSEESAGVSSKQRQSSLPLEDEPDLTSVFDLPSTANSKRDKVMELLFASLRPRTDPDEREPAEVAAAIEQCCWTGLAEKDYFSQIRSLRFNLSDPKNPDFRRKCLAGYFGDERWAVLRAEDMASVAWNQQREKIRNAALEECQSDWLMRHGGIQASGMFSCGKCKGSKTTYFQMQTRSADEPMTTFVTCLVCKNKWKFC